MIRSLLGVGDGVILAMICMTRPCGLRMRTVFINVGLGAGRYTDMPKLMPHLLRITCGLLKNIYFPEKNLPAGRQRVGTVVFLSLEVSLAAGLLTLCKHHFWPSKVMCALVTQNRGFALVTQNRGFQIMVRALVDDEVCREPGVTHKDISLTYYSNLEVCTVLPLRPPSTISLQDVPLRVSYHLLHFNLLRTSTA